jgi:hypothetical protein
MKTASVDDIHQLALPRIAATFTFNVAAALFLVEHQTTWTMPLSCVVMSLTALLLLPTLTPAPIPRMPTGHIDLDAHQMMAFRRHKNACALYLMIYTILVLGWCAFGVYHILRST